MHLYWHLYRHLYPNRLLHRLHVISSWLLLFLKVDKPVFFLIMPDCTVSCSLWFAYSDSFMRLCEQLSSCSRWCTCSRRGKAACCWCLGEQGWREQLFQTAPADCYCRSATSQECSSSGQAEVTVMECSAQQCWLKKARKRNRSGSGSARVTRGVLHLNAFFRALIEPRHTSV